MIHEFSNAVVGKAVSNGLDVKRIIFSNQKRWDGRSLLIEEKHCQIIRTSYHVSNPSFPEAVSIHLYLPRTDWPDFLIYVLRQTAGPLEYYVLPRGVLSKKQRYAQVHYKSIEMPGHCLHNHSPLIFLNVVSRL